MIQVVLGDKGTGKTKRLIDLANEALKQEQGVVVYVDDDKRYMYDLKHEIRFVDVSEYISRKNSTPDWLYGLISGMLAANYDISQLYIDAFVKLVNTDLSTLEVFFERLAQLCDRNNTCVTLSISGDPSGMPDFIARLAI